MRRCSFWMAHNPIMDVSIVMGKVQKLGPPRPATEKAPSKNLGLGFRFSAWVLDSPRTVRNQERAEYTTFIHESVTIEKTLLCTTTGKGEKSKLCTLYIWNYFLILCNWVFTIHMHHLNKVDERSKRRRLLLCFKFSFSEKDTKVWKNHNWVRAAFLSKQLGDFFKFYGLLFTLNLNTKRAALDDRFS